MRIETCLKLETRLVPNSGVLPDVRKLSKKPRKTAYSGAFPAPVGAHPDALDRIEPTPNLSYGGKTSHLNRELARRTECEQLAQQIAVWRALDIHVMMSKDLLLPNGVALGAPKPFDRLDADYFDALARDPLVSGLSLPEFECAYRALRERSRMPFFDKDLSAQPAPAPAQLFAPRTPRSYLREHALAGVSAEERALLLDTVLVDFMATVRYLERTPPKEVVTAANAWIPRGSSDAEADLAAGVAEKPEQTLFAALRDWTEATCDHYMKRASEHQLEKVSRLRKTLERRIAASMRAFRLGEGAEPDEQNAAFSARHALLNRQWRARPLGDDAGRNCLILAALSYRINHGLAQMEAVRRVVTRLDESDPFHLGGRQHAQADPLSLEDDDPPPFASYEQAGRHEEVLFAQFRWRIDRLRDRMNSHFERTPPRRPELEAALDRLHNWKLFVFSHLELARVVTDGHGCNDAYLLDEDLAHGRLSRLTLAYPCDEAAWGQEMLQSITDRFRIVDAIYSNQTTSGSGDQADSLDPMDSSSSGGILGSGTEGADGLDAIDEYEDLVRELCAGSAAPHSNAASEAALKARSGKASAPGAAAGTTTTKKTKGARKPRPQAIVNRWKDLIKSLLPKPCAGRESADRIDRACLESPEMYDYVVDCFMASMVGLYRHCRNPLRFGLALKMHRVRDMVTQFNEWRHAMLGVLFSNSELLIATLRENLVWQLSSDPALWMIDSNWVMGITHVARALFDRQGHLGGIEKAVSSGYSSSSLLSATSALPSAMAVATGEPVSLGEPTAAAAAASAPAAARGGARAPSHKSSIFRVTNNDLVAYFAGLFHSINSEAMLVAAANQILSIRVGETPVLALYRLREDAFKLVLSQVEALRPGAHIPVAAFERIGVSSEGCRWLLMAQQMYVERAHDHSVRVVLCKLSPLDYELCATFFRYLELHSQRVLVLLDPAMEMAQQCAVRRRHNIKWDAPIPLQHTCIRMCSLSACREIRNILVQQAGDTLQHGAFQLGEDFDLRVCVCLSKKTIGCHLRNVNLPTELRETWLNRYERGDLSGFSGEFVPLDKEPTSEVEEARYFSWASQAKKILTAVATFCAALKMRKLTADPEDLYSVDALESKIAGLPEKNRKPLRASQRTVRDLCTNEARQFEEFKYRQQCYRTEVLWAPSIGYAVGVEGIQLVPFTPASVCPHCGAYSIYALSLHYGPRGYTCGVCDWIDRELSHAPRCVICHQHGLERTVTSKGLQCLTYAKELRRLPMLDDSVVGGYQWRNAAHVCLPCLCAWMTKGSHSLSAILKVIASREASQLRQVVELEPPGSYLEQRTNGDWPPKVYLAAIERGRRRRLG